LEIHHQLDFIASTLANCAEGSKIVGQPVPPEPQLEPFELAFGHQFSCFLG
jgi:hypothetical protein